MKEYYDYFHAILLISPLIFYIFAISFRLLDNSGFLFLEKGIVVDSVYVSIKDLKLQIQKTTDHGFQKKLERAVFYRKCHRVCIILMILAIPLTIYTWFYLF